MVRFLDWEIMNTQKEWFIIRQVPHKYYYSIEISDN
jgi:hypothetical protein